MNAPRVSVVMPVYNGEKYLHEALQGVLGQSLTDWELLLTDDGSTDGSTAIARHFAASHPDKIRFLEHPDRANHGQFATRVFGAEQARADLIALLDQDDLWDPDYLAKHLQVWDAVRARGVHLSYGPGLYWYSDETTRSKDFVQPMPTGTPKVFGPGELLEHFFSALYANTPCPSCTLLRRDVLLGVKHFAEAAKRSAFEDQYLWWHVAARWPVAVHGNAWVRYRQHSASAVVAFATSPEYANRSELRFLEVIRGDLVAQCPTHPLLTSGGLSRHMSFLRRSRHVSSLNIQTPTEQGTLDAFKRVLPRPVKRAGRRGLDLAGRAARSIRRAIGSINGR